MDGQTDNRILEQMYYGHKKGKIERKLQILYTCI